MRINDAPDMKTRTARSSLSTPFFFKKRQLGEGGNIKQLPSICPPSIQAQNFAKAALGLGKKKYEHAQKGEGLCAFHG